MATVKAAAKINMYLRVTGTLENGYHAIETLFIPLSDTADIISIDLVPDGEKQISVTVDPVTAAPAGDSNICAKAARKTLDALGCSDSIHIHIEKHIPVAAGFGGGSSDAAAVIRYIQSERGTLPDSGRAIALECGADVPYFLNPVPAIGRGRGELLEPVEGLKIPRIKIYPFPFPVSAAWSYCNMKDNSGDGRTPDMLIGALRDGDFKRAGTLLRNDLAPAVREKFPLIRLKEKELIASGATGVQITGSGPSLYAFFE